MENPGQWQKIKEIVGAALEREPSQRAAFLDDVCPSSSPLRSEVDSLLSAHAGAGGLSEGVLTLDSDAVSVSKSLGPYRLLQKLGEGGMGQVWLAEQTVPVRRMVALKLIKGGMYDESALRRFQSERQSLAIMDHPAIAKVFDAGATPDGQPYFAMEYVPGVTITEFCDRKKLKLRERLELFIRACEGVQHAHQKAIIHRDLKPANILVVEVDGKPMPRIIDFGLAKSVTPFLSGESLNTQIGGFVGTPGYMSPEQADPAVQDVDTRADVYSLGVILYELLTGFLPFDTSGWKKLRLDEVLRHLREDDPPKPSTKISSVRDTSAPQAEARGMQPSQLVGELRGDLDWIAMKALDKDRNRRYGTPSEIAEDIRRYLNNEPIVARPATAGYRLRKYVRRHRVAVAAAAALFLLLSGFAVLQAVQLRRITRERDRANRIADFMTKMFKVSNPSEARGNSVTAREILDKSSRDIESGLSKDPELQAQMMDLMGRVYGHLGLFSTAQGLLSRAVDIRQRVLGPDDPDTLLSLNNLANCVSDQGKYPEGDKLYRRIIDASKGKRGPVERTRVMAMNNLALNLIDEGNVPEGEKMQREVVEDETRTLGPEHPDTLTSTSNVAITMRRQQHFADAEKIDRQVLEARRRVLGADHPDTLRSAANLALDLQLQPHREAEAEQLLQPTLDAQKRILGPAHLDTLESMNILAQLANQEGKPGQAEALFREIVQTERRSLGPEHPKTLGSMNNLVVILVNEGKDAEALPLIRDVLEAQRRLRGPEHFNTLLAMTNLASTLQNLKQDAESEQVGRAALEIERRKLGDENSLTLVTMDTLANSLETLGHHAEAEKLLLELVEHQTHVFGPDSSQAADSTYKLATWAAQHGERDKAILLLTKSVGHGLDAAKVANLEKDPAFKSLHGESRFEAILTQSRHPAQQKPN